MAHAHKLRLRCMLEGIEVPVIAVNIAIQPNAPAQFQIQIPATDRAFEFLPRTLVHVFFYDYWEGASPAFQIKTRDDRQVVSAAEDLDTQEQLERERSEYYENATATPPADTSFNAGPDSAANAAQPASAVSTGAPVLPEESAPSNDNFMNFLQDGELRSSPFTEQDEHWKLLIGGEVIGYDFNKSSSQRSVTLHCLDWSVYWDTCYQYQVNVANLTGDHMAAFVGAGTTFFDIFFQSGTSTIVNAVNQRSITQPELTGLLSGVVRLLESVGGVYTGNESQSVNGPNPRNIRHRFRGVNDFFSIAELRLKLVYMIAAAEHDDSSRRHFARRAFAMWGRRHASRLGKIASFREILNVMMQYIYHAVYPVVAPHFVHPSDRLRTSTRVTSTAFASSAEGQRFLRELNNMRNSAQYTINRMKYRSTDYPCSNISAQLYSLANRADQLAVRSVGYGHSSPAQHLRLVSSTARSLRNRYEGQSGSQRTIYQNYRGQIDDRTRSLIANANVAIAYFESSSIVRRNTSTRTVQTGLRLNQQIIRPDIFMVSPPRCNVIFPELSSQVQFSRMFLREVTRMRLRVSDEYFGPNQLLDQVYYAPDVEVMGAFPPRQLRRGSARVSGRRLRRAAYSKRLMDHELYTGVVPVFERMNEVNIYSARTDQVNYRGVHIPYVARAANHQFYKHRWAPRQMAVSGKFNPYTVAGFPAVVMDRYMNREASILAELRGINYVEAAGGEVVASNTSTNGVEQQVDADAQENQRDAWAVLREQVPTQFVGMIENVSHSVSSGSASSTFTLTHARTHRETEELLGANRKEVSRRSVVRARGTSRRTRGVPRRGQQQVRETDDGRAIRTHTVAALSEPRVGMVGPYFGEIIQVAASTEQGEFPLFGQYFGDIPQRRRKKYPVNTELQAIDLGEEVVRQVGSSTERVTLRAYSIQEAIDRWVGQEVEVPLEDFIRPPWMSDVWKNDRIGATYQQLLGSGAITDSTIVEAGSVFTRSAQASPVGEILARSAAEERAEKTSDPISADGKSRQEAGMDITVERAIDLLVRTYSAVRHNGFDVHEFIRAYTWRPVATLVDILGSRDLEIDEDGNINSGTEGLHSRAFGRGPMGRNLRNLVDGDVRQILGFSTAEDRGAILENLDKRADKSERVLAYVKELWNSRGLLG